MNDSFINIPLEFLNHLKNSLKYQGIGLILNTPNLEINQNYANNVDITSITPIFDGFIYNEKDELIHDPNNSQLRLQIRVSPIFHNDIQKIVSLTLDFENVK